MDAPKTLDEIFERKKRARSRLNDLPLTEKMQMALDIYRSLQTIRNAQVAVEAAPPIGGFLGSLAGKTEKITTLEEMEEATAAGWAKQK